MMTDAFDDEINDGVTPSYLPGSCDCATNACSMGKKCANALHCTFGGPQLCQCNLAFESHDVANTFNLLRLPNLRMRKPKSSPRATWLERLFIWGQDLFEASAL